MSAVLAVVTMELAAGLLDPLYTGEDTGGAGLEATGLVVDEAG